MELLTEEKFNEYVKNIKEENLKHILPRILKKIVFINENHIYIIADRMFENNTNIRKFDNKEAIINRYINFIKSYLVKLNNHIKKFFNFRDKKINIYVLSKNIVELQLQDNNDSDYILNNTFLGDLNFRYLAGITNKNDVVLFLYIYDQNVLDKLQTIIKDYKNELKLIDDEFFKDRTILEELIAEKKEQLREKYLKYESSKGLLAVKNWFTK